MKDKENSSRNVNKGQISVDYNIDSRNHIPLKDSGVKTTMQSHATLIDPVKDDKTNMRTSLPQFSNSNMDPNRSYTKWAGGAGIAGGHGSLAFSHRSGK